LQNRIAVNDIFEDIEAAPARRHGRSHGGPCVHIRCWRDGFGLCGSEIRNGTESCGYSKNAASEYGAWIPQNPSNAGTLRFQCDSRSNQPADELWS
jgi:hypothetical protein